MSTRPARRCTPACGGEPPRCEEESHESLEPGVRADASAWSNAHLLARSGTCWRISARSARVSRRRLSAESSATSAARALAATEHLDQGDLQRVHRSDRTRRECCSARRPGAASASSRIAPIRRRAQPARRPLHPHVEAGVVERPEPVHARGADAPVSVPPTRTARTTSAVRPGGANHPSRTRIRPPCADSRAERRQRCTPQRIERAVAGDSVRHLQTSARQFIHAASVAARQSERWRRRRSVTSTDAGPRPFSMLGQSALSVQPASVASSCEARRVSRREARQLTFA